MCKALYKLICFLFFKWH